MGYVIVSVVFGLMATLGLVASRFATDDSMGRVGIIAFILFTFSALMVLREWLKES